MEDSVLEACSISDDNVPFELESLSKAINYQKWISDLVLPFMGKRVLEIGAGIGNMSSLLPLRERLILSEANLSLLPKLKNKIQNLHKEDPRVSVQCIDLNSNWQEAFDSENLDTIISFNVLEHIENDFAALESLLNILRQSNSSERRRLITFVPAHQWAFGTIDRNFGHYRRYSHKDFQSFAKRLNYKIKLSYCYFNLIGLASWFLCNRILKKNNIGTANIQIFEKLIPILRPIDDFLHRRIKLRMGQSICAVMEVFDSN